MKERNNNLIAFRNASGKTQRDIAKILGVTYQEYQNWEYGMNKKAIQTAIRIAKAVGKTVEEIWGGNPIPKV